MYIVIPSRGEIMAGKRISDDVRQKVAKAYEEGQPRKKIAETYGISPTSVSRIVREKGAAPQVRPKPAPKTALSPEMLRKLADMERRVKELEEKILYFEARKQGKGTRA